MRRSRAAIGNALRLDPELADGWIQQGSLVLFHDQDVARARTASERGLALAPGSAEGHASYAWCLTAVGEHRQAIEQADEARRLDPVRASLAGDLGLISFYGRNYAQAESAFRLMTEINPDSRFAKAGLADALVESRVARDSMGAVRRCFAGTACIIGGKTRSPPISRWSSFD